jgi:hypothetical protein
MVTVAKRSKDQVTSASPFLTRGPTFLPGKGGYCLIVNSQRREGRAPLNIATLGPDFGEQLPMPHLPSHTHTQSSAVTHTHKVILRHTLSRKGCL